MTAPASTSSAARKIIGFSLAGIALLLVLILAGAWFVARTELRPFAERRLTQMLDRQVTIGSLDVTWQNPLQVEIGDVHLANQSWGSTPDMGSIKSISALIDARALLAGHLRFLKLTIMQPVLVLERDPQGIGNWRFGASANRKEEKQSDNAAVEPTGRSDFPILLDFTLQDGKVSYRTYSGHILRVDLDQVTINTTGDDQPVDLKAGGAYNGGTLALVAKTHSFNELHDTAKPFGTTLTLSRQSAKLTFDGTMIDPLDVDGADGVLSAETARLSDILEIFHTKLSADPPAALQGRLTRQDDLWHLTEAAGKLADNTLTGHMTLREGRHGQGDDIDVATDFKSLDLGPLLAGDGTQKSSGGSGNWQQQPLETPDKTAPHLTARLTADDVVYKDVKLGAVDLNGHLAPGDITVAPSSLTYAGVPLKIAGTLTPAGDGGKLSAEATTAGIDAATLLKSLGSTSRDLSGKISAGVSLVLTGKTVQEGLKASKGGAVLSMTNGRISRDLLEKASTDLRNVFRKGEGTAQVVCLLGVMHLQNGIGQLSPLRLQTSQAVINGQGRIDFLHESLDITLQSDHKTTDFLALDIPLHLTGPWQQPAVDISGKSVKVKPAALMMDDLSPALRGIAGGNACHS
jgi:uncharacterized protein involved in outer membrane biogenesis